MCTVAAAAATAMRFEVMVASKEVEKEEGTVAEEVAKTVASREAEKGVETAAEEVATTRAATTISTPSHSRGSSLGARVTARARTGRWRAEAHRRRSGPPLHGGFDSVRYFLTCETCIRHNTPSQTICSFNTAYTHTVARSSSLGPTYQFLTHPRAPLINAFTVSFCRSRE